MDVQLSLVISITSEISLRLINLLTLPEKEK